MKTDKPRLVIHHRAAELVQSLTGPMNNEFETQIASSDQAICFLIDEWEPLICLVDDSDEGLHLVEKVRSGPTNSPIGIVVLARSADLIREQRAFRAGADHFLTVPVEYSSVCSRVKALATRVAKYSGRTLELEKNCGPQAMDLSSNITIYPNDYLVKREGKVVATSPLQFRLLLAFVSHPDKLLSREWLKEQVWQDAEISPRSIDAQVSKLKKLLPELDTCINNIYGHGYVYTAPVSKVA